MIWGKLRPQSGKIETLITRSSRNRQFLHAKTLGFTHPKSGKELEFSSILPQDLENILKMLRNINK